MVGDISGIGRAIEALTELIKYPYEKYSKHKTNKKEETLKLLKAASKALRETLRYLKKAPNIRDPKEEEKLSDFWSEVATAAWPLNPDLAQRCYLKANYWADTERWTEEQSKSTRIKISEMEDEIGKLFGGMKKKVRKGGKNAK